MNTDKTPSAAWKLNSYEFRSKAVTAVLSSLWAAIFTVITLLGNADFWPLYVPVIVVIVALTPMAEKFFKGGWFVNTMKGYLGIK